MEERMNDSIKEHKHPESGYDYWHVDIRRHAVQTDIKILVDGGYWNNRVSGINPTDKANYSTCPNCKSSNTRWIQNALTFIKNPVFSQGEEWLGYCHECGTLYEYYTAETMYTPKETKR